MKLENYVKEIMKGVPSGAQIEFDVGLSIWNFDEIHIGSKSQNRIKFTIRSEGKTK